MFIISIISVYMGMGMGMGMSEVGGGWGGWASKVKRTWKSCMEWGWGVVVVGGGEGWGGGERGLAISALNLSYKKQKTQTCAIKYYPLKLY